MSSRSILVLLGLLSFQLGSTQDVYRKISKQICHCMEKDGASQEDPFSYCMEEVAFKYIKEIKASQGVETIDEVDSEILGFSIGKHMLEICPNTLIEMSDDVVDFPTFEKDSLLICDEILYGEYYYLTPNVQTLEFTDTTFVTITESRYMERMKGGRTYSDLDLEWIAPCAFKVIFVESNDAMKKTISEPGDEYDYTIISNDPKALILSTYFGDREFHMEFIRLE